MPKILTSTYIGVEFNYSELFILNHVNILMSGLRLTLLCDAVGHKGNRPSQLASLGVKEELVKSGQLAAEA